MYWLNAMVLKEIKVDRGKAGCPQRPQLLMNLQRGLKNFWISDIPYFDSMMLWAVATVTFCCSDE